jgi:hypothetical protein
MGRLLSGLQVRISLIMWEDLENFVCQLSLYLSYRLAVPARTHPRIWLVWTRLTFLLASALVVLDARVRDIGIAALAVITMQVQGFANGATMGASAAGAAVYTDSGCRIPCSGPGISARFMQ